MTIPNQAPDSSVAGILQPTPPDPPWTIAPGQALEDYLQQYVAAVAHLDGTMVRPRWQEDPPNLPDYGLDWCAVGITQRRAIGTYAAVIHHPGNWIRPGGQSIWDADQSKWDETQSTWDAGAAPGGEPRGYDEMQRHEELSCLASFYGPGADDYATNLHSGLSIWQNTNELRLVGLAFVEVGDHQRVPELIKNRWWNRVDKMLTLRRIIRSVYPVLNLLSFAGHVRTDTNDYQAPFHGP